MEALKYTFLGCDLPVSAEAQASPRFLGSGFLCKVLTGFYRGQDSNVGLFVLMGFIRILFVGVLIEV